MSRREAFGILGWVQVAVIVLLVAMSARQCGQAYRCEEAGGVYSRDMFGIDGRCAAPLRADAPGWVP